MDNAATTKPLNIIKEAYKQYAENEWYNPSALYAPSAHASKKMDDIRKTILTALHAHTGHIVFTSGGTESNNLAIMHAASVAKNGHFVISAYEHASGYATVKAVEQAGYTVSFIMPNDDGIIEPETVANAVNEQTLMVSMMHVNNETGALNDINAIAEKVKQKNAKTFFHADGVQGFLKVPFIIGDAIDFYSMSAHKIGGIKGTGALYVKNPKNLRALLYGGAQESGMRAGTENTFGITAFGLAVEHHALDYDKANALRQRLLNGVNQIEDSVINSPLKDGCYSPYIVNVSFLGVRSETLLHALETEHIYIGIGSACSSHKRTNRIHDALGLKPEIAESAVRISFGEQSTQEEIDIMLIAIEKQIKILRQFKRR